MVNIPGGDSLPLIKEVVVVEGKDDVAAVKRACRAQTIITSGLGISREILEEIRAAQKRCGVILLTDPDGPGAKIRQIINQAVPGCKQAYLYRERRDKRPVGVEYAEPAGILAALEGAKATLGEPGPVTFTLTDMAELGLAGGWGSQGKRDWLSRRLGLGQTNGKQFLRRLNNYGVSRQEFLAAYQEMTVCQEKPVCQKTAACQKAAAHQKTEACQKTAAHQKTEGSGQQL